MAGGKWYQDTTSVPPFCHPFPKREIPDSGDSDPTLSRYTPSGIEVPMANGNVIKIPVVDSDINISEEMNKSGLWKSVDQGQSTANNGNGPHKNGG